MDAELRELHRGAKEERKRMIPDPGPVEGQQASKRDDSPEYDDPPDMEMECRNCDWEGLDSQVRYKGFQRGSRYTWKQVQEKNIDVEGMACPMCDKLTAEPSEDL